MKTLGTIVAGVGVLVILIGGGIFIREQVFLMGAAEAVAVVTGNESVTYTGNINEMGVQHYFCSAFEFEDQNGQKVVFQQTEGDWSTANCGNLDSAADFKVGDTVPVRYDPRDPAHTAQIPKLTRKYYNYALTIALVGLLPLAIGLLFRREAEQVRKLEEASQQRRLERKMAKNDARSKKNGR